jgi:hypothetical protein
LVNPLRNPDQPKSALDLRGRPNRLAVLDTDAYARIMAAWYLPIALALLALACVFMGFFGAESRPGFNEDRSDRKDRWFYHSKND